MVHDAEIGEGVGLAEAVAEAAEQREGLPEAGGGGRVVSGLLLHHAQAVEGVRPAQPVTGAAGQRQGTP